MCVSLGQTEQSASKSCAVEATVLSENDDNFAFSALTFTTAIALCGRLAFDHKWVNG